MNFASDNTAGVSGPILEAMTKINGGNVTSYGADEFSAAVERQLSRVFEREVNAFLVTTGTAANALSLAAVTPPWGCILCHEASHANTDECGAPEFFSGGAKLIGLAGSGAKISPTVLKGILESYVFGVQHHVQPAAVTISQATEFGLVWTPEEIAETAKIAHSHGLKVHMDGARFGNAVAALDVSPADLSWRAGVDLMSFGATKNGAMCAEAIVVFSSEIAETIRYRRKRAGHLISKSRFIAAQLLAYLEDDHWLDLARHANEMASQLAKVISATSAPRLAAPVEANEVFAFLDEPAHQRLKAAGAMFYDWSGDGPGMADPARPGERLVRLVTSFSTQQEEIDRFRKILAGY